MRHSILYRLPLGILTICLLAFTGCDLEGGGSGTGDPEGQACGMVNPCPTGYECVQGTCINRADNDNDQEAGCSSTQPCQTGYVCQNGTCVLDTNQGGDHSGTEPQCGPSKPCPTGYTCNNGTCVVDSTGNQSGCGPHNPCPTGYTCNNGSCVPTSTGSTGLSCSELNECIGNCSQDDEACINRCVDDASATAVNQFNAIWECIDRVGCDQANTEEEFYECIGNNCSQEMNACFSSGSGSGSGSGNMSCSEMNQCFGNCNEGDQNCIQDCFSSSTTQAQNQYNAIWECYENAGCPEAYDPDCMEANCANELNACFPTPSGNMSCAEMNDCFHTCSEGDQDCIQDCFASATTQAQNQYNAIWECSERSGCDDASTDEEFNDCLDAHCSNEVNACFNS